MPPRHTHVFIATGSMACAANIFISCSGPDDPTWLGIVFIGLLWGSVIAQVILAAAWVPLGPLPFKLRLLLSLLWISQVQAALGIVFCREQSGDQWDEELISIIFLFILAISGLWILVQVPLWLLYILTAAQIRHPGNSVDCHDLQDRQFGIGQVMIFTAAVCIILAAIKGICSNLFEEADEMPISEVTFLLTATSTIVLPLLLAGLLSKFRLLAILGAIVLIAVATWVEVTWFSNFGEFSTKEGKSILVATNIVTALWVLIVTSLLKWSGYRLTTSSNKVAAA